MKSRGWCCHHKLFPSQTLAYHLLLVLGKCFFECFDFVRFFGEISFQFFDVLFQLIDLITVRGWMVMASSSPAAWYHTEHSFSYVMFCVVWSWVWWVQHKPHQTQTRKRYWPVVVGGWVSFQQQWPVQHGLQRLLFPFASALWFPLLAMPVFCCLVPEVHGQHRWWFVSKCI